MYNFLLGVRPVRPVWCVRLDATAQTRETCKAKERRPQLSKTLTDKSSMASTGALWGQGDLRRTVKQFQVKTEWCFMLGLPPPTH